MNDTKWKQLQAAVDNLPFPPPYQMKVLTEEAPVNDFNEDVSYLGDWGDEAFYNWGCYSLIEWIKVRPRRLIPQGRLIPAKLIDESAEFEAILLQYNIYFEKDADAYIIYGYKAL